MATKKKVIPLFFFLIFFQGVIFSQEQLFVRGKIIDAKDSSGIPGVQLLLISVSDSTKFRNEVTDSSGKFVFGNIQPGKFKFKALNLGYRTFIKEIEVIDRPVILRKIVLQLDEQLLKQVEVEAVQIRQEQKGDTTQYNADAFKVNKDATTEDLVKKMPGVTIENGTVKHQGEDVKKVLIDGREFFGDDANIALKNLPAEMVDKVQVYDRASDLGFFSGFDDGNAQKTMNIMTKGNKNKGTFGKAFGGYGLEDNETERYQAGGNFNLFQGIRRISVVAMSNNINMQNFGSQDLLGLTGSQGGQRGGMGGIGGMGGWGKGGSGGGGGNQSNNSAMNFVVGQQGGISTTHSIGTNYTDTWGKKILATASYFFNYTDNNAGSELQRNFFSTTGNGQEYQEEKTALTGNGNHRFNLRMEYYIDTMNSIVFNPRLSLQSNTADNLTTGATSIMDTFLLSSINSNYKTKFTGYNSNNTLLYRKRLKKYGRTFSVQFNADLNDKTGTTTNYSKNTYLMPSDTTITLDQNAENANGGQTYGSSVSYTEPIGKLWALQATYNPSINFNYADKKTFNRDETNNVYQSLDSILSNEYKNTIQTQKGGINLRIKKETWMIGGGINFQTVSLKGDQRFPYAATVSKSFENFLPTITMQFRFTKNTNLRFNYRTSTNLPSVTQLQNVVDNSNTLLLSTGNPDLRQNYSHFANIRFNVTNPTTSRSFFFFIMTNVVQDYIGNSTFLARQDTTLDGGIILRQGSQLNKPVNIDGNWVVRSFSTYSTPIKKIKSTLNLNLGFSYSNLPGLINGQKNIATTSAFNSGIVLASNISDKLDFTITWNGYYNLVSNTLQTTANNNYLYHLSTAKLNWNFYKSFFLATEANYTYYDGLQGNFTQKFLLWNNSIAYKFLKNNSGEIKLSVYDALKQNNSLSRSVTETYIEDNQTRVLQRYYMLTFTWTFRKFQKQENDGKRHEGRQ
jgi:Outer membrane protein beta-barrel family